MSLFTILWDALSPYLFDILKMAFAMSLFKMALRILRQKSGSMNNVGNSNPYQSIFATFGGYLLGKGIPVFIKITDRICNEILANLG